MGFLNKYLAYDNIVIQCHDNPDADALASGFGLWLFFKKNDRNVRFVYGGRNEITKPNLKLMVEKLGIPAEYVKELDTPDLLITADCQYGEGNVTRFDAKKVAMIDHHQFAGTPGDDCCIRSNLASCATIVWDLLLQEGIDPNDDKALSTALYYGLYSDSNQFEELFHPMDRDMRDRLIRDEALLIRLINSNISIDELGVASEALNDQTFFPEDRFSVIESRPCDPNILGIISDFVIQVQEVDTCVAYNPGHGGYKLSVRSCVPVTKANELARYLCEGIGNGGGHRNKAGGFIASDLFEKSYPEMGIRQYLSERMTMYHHSFEVIDALSYDMDTSDMELYIKKSVPVGYVIATDVLKAGTPILIRTLEGDVDQIISDDLYLMVGIEGEVYPIREEKFKSSYELTDLQPEFETDYIPTIHDTIYGESYSLKDYIRPCIATGKTRIYAKKLNHMVKVFTAWDPDKYYLGNPGDFIVVREDDPHDIYVVRGSIFDKTYERIA